MNTSIYKKVDEELYQASKGLRLLPLLTPLNLKEERQRFFNDKYYNPHFSYPVFDKNKIKKTAENLRKLKIKQENFLGRIFERKRKELIVKSDLILSRNSPDFYRNSYLFFGEPSQDTAVKAEKIVKRFYQGNLKPPRFLSKEEIHKAFVERLEKYALPVRISLKNDLPSRSKRRTGEILLRSDLRYTKSTLEGALKHEIETHFLRKANGMRQKFKIFSQGTAGYTFLEEGLATAHKMLSRGKPYLRSISLYVLAMVKGRDASFRAVFDYLKEFGPNQDQAFFHTLRVKLGVEDTEMEGSFTKDLVYFEGFRQLVDFIKKNRTFKAENFYLGKIGFFELENLAKIDWLKENLLIPNFIREPDYFEKIIDIGKFNGIN